MKRGDLAAHPSVSVPRVRECLALPWRKPGLSFHKRPLKKAGGKVLSMDLEQEVCTFTRSASANFSAPGKAKLAWLQLDADKGSKRGDGDKLQ